MKPLRILLVEDSENDADLLAYHLKRLEVEASFTRVDTPAALRAALAERTWDIVISDYRMPHFNGLAALRMVREHSRHLPFIIVSATIGEDIAVDSMRAGANDYVMKNNLARLLPAIRRELAEARMRAEYLAARKSQQEMLDHLSHYDSVTGLANRALFCERLTQLFKTAGCETRKLAVMVVDIDNFKSVTDRLGSRLADAALTEAAARLARCNGDPVRVARVGADRFALVLPQVVQDGVVARVLDQQLDDCFALPFELEDTQLQLAVTAGIALFPADGDEPAAILEKAEAAVGRARESGERYLYYTEEMSVRIAEKLDLENRLRKALANEEFLLHYQPKVDARTRQIVAVEALIRWQCPDLGLVSPALFIPLLEETGLILEVGAWVMKRAAQDYVQWQALGLTAPRVAVNVSVIQLRAKDFVEVVRNAISRDGIAPGIDLEITESLLLEDTQAGFEKLEAIHAQGVNIALDDFGMGYSSLGYLVKLPIQTIKIDMSFVAAMVNDPDTRTLVAMIVSLAHSLRLTVVAEGVETEHQAAMLNGMGCEQLQGYLFGRPVSFDAMTALLTRGELPRRQAPD